MTGMPTCPVSWLELERLALGELEEARAARVREHVASCEACGACWARIQDDEARELPPLPAKVIPLRPRAGRAEPNAPSRAFGGVVGAVALAASVLLFFALRPAAEDDGGVRVKGTDVGLEIVREGGGGFALEAGTFSPEDRFKAVVSCPPHLRATFDLVVYDESGASFPLKPAQLACGNGVPMPGAFRLTSARNARVCVAWSAQGDVSRDALRADAQTPNRVCKNLVRAP
jgi:hypothetical protein